MRLDCKDTVDRFGWMDKLDYVKLGRPDRAIRMDESTEGQNETGRKIGYDKLCGLYGSSFHNHVSPPCISTLYVHPVSPPCMSTLYLHPVCPPVSPPCMSTLYLHPVCPPCISTLYVHPVLPAGANSMN